jgi:serine phosphatase RsbU (regulator of sigma subunit)/Tfp pilus assembly protein PilF
MKIRLIIALFFLGFAFSSKATDNTVDSLINLTVNEKNDSILLKLYNNIGGESYQIDQNLAKIYWNKAYALGQKLVKSDTAFVYKEQFAISNNGLGIIARREGDYSTALSYYQNCLKIEGDIYKDKRVGNTLMNIAVIYRNLKEYDKALEYLNESISIAIGNKDSVCFPAIYNGMGMVYRRKNEYDKALEYYNKSLQISLLLKDSSNIAESNNNIGAVYYRTGDFDKAIEYLKKGYQVHLSNNNQAGIANYHKSMIQVYKKSGNKLMALTEGKLAYDSYSKMGRKVEMSEIANSLSQLYSSSNKYEKALEYYKNYISLRDSVFNEKTTKEITEKAMQYEFDKQTMSDSLARAEIEKITALEHQQEIKQQRILMYGGGFILLLVIIFSIVVYNRLKISNRQKATIERQKLVVEIKNKEITDSINYAKRIQSAILPSIDKIKESLPNSFVFYKPKDIVAGDFYWYKKVNNKIFIAVADCTGHGVPGAMVSVVCNNALNRAVNDFWLLDPAKILDKTAELVIEAFKSNKEEDVKDGMDISLCSFDIENNKLEFAGAINSMFYIRNNQLEEIKGDKQPIGQFVNIKPFTLHKLNLEKGDKIYLFSDGYADQFGGVKGKKFMYRRFRELILGVSSKEFSTQKNELELEFKNWRKDIEQLDDVCVVGIEV